MKTLFSNSALFFSLLSFFALAACTPSNSSPPPINYTCEPYAGTSLTPTAANRMPINVGCHYTNQPCVSVTICMPGSVPPSANCQTVNDILLDTGSYGLRLFSCATTLNLPSVTMYQQTVTVPLSTGGLPAASGSFELNFSGSTSSAIVYNATLPAIQTAVQSMTGLAAATVNGVTYQSNGAISIVVINMVGVVGVPALMTVLADSLADTSAVAITPTVLSAAPALAEFTGFADGSCDWGPVQTADIYLGSGTAEFAANTPVHMINYQYPNMPSAGATGFDCTSLDYSPTEAGFNGILGIGMAQTDCGSFCNSTSNNGVYFACTNASCLGVLASNNNTVQVTNPVSKMTTNNNGTILTFPSVPDLGAASLIGTFTWGIDTAGNNSSAGATHTFAADGNAEFQTTYTRFSNSPMTASFIDSGSNTYAFPDNNSGGLMPACGDTSIAPGFYCPATTQTGLSANQIGATGAPNVNVGFHVSNAAVELDPNNPNVVFSDLAAGLPGIASSPYFDWGFPFFTGRSVFTSIGTRVSGLGPGPYWAW